MKNKKRGFALIFVLIGIVLLSSFCAVSESKEDIKINGFVNDYAKVISPEYSSKIENVLKSIYDSKTAEFSIVTITYLEGQDIESYALNLAQGKLGDKEKNNGLLLLVSVEDRKYRFEVGRGLEPIFNDAKIGRIGRTYLIENFRNQEYGKGIYEASLAVKSILLNETQSEYYVQECVCQEGEVALYKRVLGKESCSCQPLKKLLPWVILAIIIFIGVFALIIYQLIKFNKNNKGIKRKEGYYDAAFMLGLVLSGRKGGGGGPGGFGGFGGGGFGGGGSSGGW